MKVRKRDKIALPLMADDSIELVYTDDDGKETTLIEERIGREMTIDEVVIFDVEPGDLDSDKGGIGGAFLEQKEAGDGMFNK